MTNCSLSSRELQISLVSHGVRECREIYGVKNVISVRKLDAFFFCRIPVGGWNAFYVGICFCFPVPAGIPGEVWLRELRCGGNELSKDLLLPSSYQLVEYCRFFVWLENTLAVTIKPKGYPVVVCAWEGNNIEQSVIPLFGWFRSLTILMSNNFIQIVGTRRGISGAWEPGTGWNIHAFTARLAWL